MGRAVLIKGLVSLGFIAICMAHASPVPDQEVSTREKALQFFSASPAAFIENTGQIDDPSIRYVFNGSGANVFHTTTGPVFQVFQRGDAGAAYVGADFASLRANRPPFAEPASSLPTTCSRVFSATFPGARQVKPVGRDVLETKINYCLGADHSRWQMDVPTFGVVVYEGLYDGIDLHTYGRRSNLKYEFHLAPGADWRQIRIRYSGIAGLSLAKDGSLIVNVGDGWGCLTDDAPVIYQQIAGKRTELPGRFVLVDKVTYAFEIDGLVKADAPLVIDPELAWSTYLGSNDEGYGVAIDADGNVLVTGRAYPSGWVSGGFDISFNGGSTDAFVAKLGPNGEHLWSTYLGGSGDDTGHGVAVDASGNVVVTGETNSSGWVSGGFGTTYNGGYDAFVAKLSPSGEHLWSTYFGGSDADRSYGVAVDASGNVAATGVTSSSGWVSGGFNTTYNGNSDAFVAKLSPSGQHLWSTYLGGSQGDYGSGVAVDASSNVLLTGETNSSGWVSGGFDTSFNVGHSDAFAAKISPSGEHLWSTYLGESNNDSGYGMAVDAIGNVLVTGQTASTGWVSGGFDTTFNGNFDVFVAKLSPEGQHLWSAYLGGIEFDRGTGVAVDGSGNLLVTGATRSSGWVSGGFGTTFNDSWDWDAFAAKLSPSGQHMWSTYLGGSNGEFGFGVAVDASGNVVVAGDTDSSGWVYGGFDTTYNGGLQCAFVAKIDDRPVLSVSSSPISGVQITGDEPGVTDYTAACDLTSTVTLAAPATTTVEGKHYSFVKWTLDGVDQPDNPISITMDADHTAVAEYDVCAWTLSVNSFPIGGAAIAGDASGTTPFTSGCTAGDSVQLSAPATITVDGKTWYFAYWLVNTAAQARYRRDAYITVNDDTTATAVYDPTIRGDVNGDCKVNVLDLIDARNRLGSACSQ